MNTVTRIQAENLAIQYYAFCKSVDDDDKAMWAEMLLKTQNETHITLICPYNLKDWIKLED